MAIASRRCSSTRSRRGLARSAAASRSASAWSRWWIRQAASSASAVTGVTRSVCSTVRARIPPSISQSVATGPGEPPSSRLGSGTRVGSRSPAVLSWWWRQQSRCRFASEVCPPSSGWSWSYSRMWSSSAAGRGGGRGGRGGRGPGGRGGGGPRPGRRPGGGVPGGRGRDGREPVEHRGGVLQSQQRRDRHGDEDLVGAAGLLDRVDVQHGVGEDRVAQRREGEGAAPLGEVAVDVEGQRPLLAVAQGGALRLLHGARGDVEPVREALDLGDRSGDVERGGAGLRVDVEQLDRAGGPRRLGDGARGREPHGEADLRLEGGLGDRGDLHPGEVAVHGLLLLVVQPPHLAQQVAVEVLGHVAACEVREGRRHEIHGGAGVQHHRPGAGRGGAQAHGDLHAGHVRVLGDAAGLGVLAEEHRELTQLVGVEAGPRLHRAVQGEHPRRLDRAGLHLGEQLLLIQRPTGSHSPARGGGLRRVVGDGGCLGCGDAALGGFVGGRRVDSTAGAGSRGGVGLGLERGLRPLVELPHHALLPRSVDGTASVPSVVETENLFQDSQHLT